MAKQRKNYAKVNSKSRGLAQALAVSSDDSAIDRPKYVVALGASAGGLEALERFFRAVPKNSGFCFVVVQHLSPDFKSLMAELLERFNDMPVVPVEEPQVVKSDTVFLLPPRKEITIKGDQLIPRAREKDGSLSLPINTFFQSLALEWKDRGIAVVLSGTGSDGSKGAMEVREAGGLVFAQSPETAAFDGMPQNVIRTGCVDLIAAPEDLPEAISHATNRLGQETTISAGRSSSEEIAGLELIHNLLIRFFGLNLSEYKPGTIERRIERRVALQMPSVTLNEYAKILEQQPEELSNLYKDLLIGVTSFNRDPNVFDHLANNTVPYLITTFADEDEIRIWVAGCSTGEEVYSLAILILEGLETIKNSVKKIKIIATDLHDDSLRWASDGVYSGESLEKLPQALKTKYFIATGDDFYKVTPALRKNVVFSKHNLLSDPPFTRMHFVSCRNLLIYLTQKAQSKAISNLAYSLVLNGVLLLGVSETIAENPCLEASSTLDRKFKVYRRNSMARISQRMAFGHEMTMPGSRGESNFNLTPQSYPRYFEALAEQLIPSGFLVNDSLEIIHIFGAASELIETPRGKFSGSLVNFLRKELATAINSLFHKIKKDDIPEIELKGISVRFNHIKETKIFDIRVLYLPAQQKQPKSYLIEINERKSSIETTPAPSFSATDAKTLNSEHVSELERELQSTRETLQTTIEELETTNEELQSTNEELLSSNEELQSTNEELHSVNEELYSVNSEHEAKIDELNKKSSELFYLMENSDTATVFIDKDLNISLFTPRIREIFNVVQTDVGRCLEDFTCRVSDPDLFSDIKRTSKTRVTCERELKITQDGVYWLRRCTPLINRDNEIVGFVINYSDVTFTIAITERALSAENSINGLLNAIPGSVALFDENQQLIFSNKKFNERFKTRKNKNGNVISAKADAAFFELNQLAFNKKSSIQTLEIDEKNSGKIFLATRFLFSNGPGPDKKRSIGYVSFDSDVLGNEIASRDAFVLLLIESSTDPIVAFDRNGNCAFANKKYLNLAGFKRNEPIPNDWNFQMHVIAFTKMGFYPKSYLKNSPNFEAILKNPKHTKSKIKGTKFNISIEEVFVSKSKSVLFRYRLK